VRRSTFVTLMLKCLIAWVDKRNDSLASQRGTDSPLSGKRVRSHKTITSFRIKNFYEHKIIWSLYYVLFLALNMPCTTKAFGSLMLSSILPADLGLAMWELTQGETYKHRCTAAKEWNSPIYAGTSVCAPSRSALMTGQHATGQPYTHSRKQGYTYLLEVNGSIPVSAFTIAELFKKCSGIKPAILEKWGLGL